MTEDPSRGHGQLRFYSSHEGKTTGLVLEASYAYASVFLLLGFFLLVAAILFIMGGVWLAALSLALALVCTPVLWFFRIERVLEIDERAIRFRRGDKVTRDLPWSHVKLIRFGTTGIEGEVGRILDVRGRMLESISVDTVHYYGGSWFDAMASKVVAEARARSIPVQQLDFYDHAPGPIARRFLGPNTNMLALAGAMAFALLVLFAVAGILSYATSAPLMGLAVLPATAALFSAGMVYLIYRAFTGRAAHCPHCDRRRVFYRKQNQWICPVCRRPLASPASQPVC